MSESTEPVVAVVVAAGSGVRLGAAGPKALCRVGGVSLVRHAADRLVAAGVDALVVTAQAEHRAAFEDALAGLAVPVRVGVGGTERQDSVRLGLAEAALLLGPAAAERAIVLVHDAARPFAPREVCAAVIAAVRAGAGVVIPAVAVVDSMRSVAGQPSRVVDRGPLRAVQTPQGFRLGRLIEAHARLLDSGRQVTDDAAACEALGERVVLVPGSRESLKITEPFDLLIAGAVLAHQSSGEQVPSGRAPHDQVLNVRGRQA